MPYATWTNVKPHPWWKILIEPVTDPAARASVIQRLELLARLLDDAFLLPGTKYHIGWDAIIGLVPGVGDTATTLLSAYIVWEAKRLGVSRWTIAQMLANIGIDFLIGIVPGVGDLFDFAWKANRRNMSLLRRALRREADRARNWAHSLHPTFPQISG